MLFCLFDLPVDIIRCVLANLSSKNISYLDMATCSSERRARSWLPALRGMEMSIDPTVDEYDPILCHESVLQWAASREVVGKFRTSFTALALGAKCSRASRSGHPLRAQSIEVQVFEDTYDESDTTRASWAWIQSANIECNIITRVSMSDEFWSAVPRQSVTRLRLLGPVNQQLISSWSRLTRLELGVTILPPQQLLRFLALQTNSLERLTIFRDFIEPSTTNLDSLGDKAHAPVLLPKLHTLELQDDPGKTFELWNAILCMILPCAVSLTELSIKSISLSSECVVSLLRHHIWRPRDHDLTIRMHKRYSRLCNADLSARASEWITSSPPCTRWEVGCRSLVGWTDYLPISQQRIVSLHNCILSASEGLGAVRDLPASILSSIETFDLDSDDTRSMATYWKEIWASPKLREVSFSLLHYRVSDATDVLPVLPVDVKSSGIRSTVDLSVSLDFSARLANPGAILTGLSCRFAHRLVRAYLRGLRVSGAEVVEFVSTCRQLRTLNISRIVEFDTSTLRRQPKTYPNVHVQGHGEPVPHGRSISVDVEVLYLEAGDTVDRIRGMVGDICATIRNIFTSWKNHTSSYRDTVPVDMRVEFSHDDCGQPSVVEAVLRDCAKELSDLHTVHL